MDELDPRHGTNAGHVAGCRDDCCRTAHNAYRRSLWRKHYALRVDRLYVDATPTHRRLHALQALGWRYIDIDREMGHLTSKAGSTRSHNYVHQSRIHLDNARLVAEVYDRLCMTLGPSARVRKVAASKGWAPPLAWLNIEDLDEQPAGAYQPRANTTPSDDAYDESVVIRILTGDWRIPCTAADKAEVVARWTLRDPLAKDRGLSRGDWDKPSYAYLERLTGWKVARYVTAAEDVA